MYRFLVMASGEDRPGIVAGVTRALADSNFNLEDTAMTRLGGRFVMLLMVSAGRHSHLQVEAALEQPASQLGLDITVTDLGDVAAASTVDSGELWSLSVYGADHPGIVAAIADRLASLQANINDVSTRLVGEGENATYAMLLDVSLPAGVDPDAFRVGLDELAEELDVSCHARPVEADTL